MIIKNFYRRVIALILIISMEWSGYTVAELNQGMNTPTDLLPVQNSSTTQAGPTELNITAASPTDLQQMAATPTDLQQMAASPTDLRQMAASPTDLHEDAASPTDIGAETMSLSELLQMAAAGEGNGFIPLSISELDFEDMESEMLATPTDLGQGQLFSQTGTDTMVSSPTDLVFRPVTIRDEDGSERPGQTIGAADVIGESMPVSGDSFAEEKIDQDFTDLKIGNVIRMGYYEQDGNIENNREPIEWKVISQNKRKKVALVATVYAIETMSYGIAGDEEEYTKTGLNWKTAAIREWLNGEFYESNFTEEEKERIRLATNVTKDPSGRFTTKDHVFLLSQIEAKRYFKTKKGLCCEATPYVINKLGDDSTAIAKDGYCLWWVREMAQAVKVDRRGEKKRNTFNEAGYVYGGRGMAMYLRKKGAKTFEENVALVRPAMWIRYD